MLERCTPIKVTVLGACAAWPTPGHACSGYLVEHDGFRFILDLGYATLPNLLRTASAESIDAVLITHGHPDHCADLHPLLRARALGGEEAPRLPVYTQPHAIDAVLALDRPGMLDAAYECRGFNPGQSFEVGPFSVETRPLPHFLPNVGIRIAAGGRVLAYATDSGPSPELLPLAEGADLLIADATYAEHVPEDASPYLSSGRAAGELAARAGVRRLLLTHLWPNSDAHATKSAACIGYTGRVDVAMDGAVIDL